MTVDSPKFVKKKRKSAVVSADYSKMSLILDYEISVTVVSGSGRELETKHHSKKKSIPLKKILKENTDIESLAHKIIESSSLIPITRYDHIVQLLKDLRDYRLSNYDSSSEFDNSLVNRTNFSEDFSAKTVTVAIDNLDEYIADLYDENVARRLQSAEGIYKLSCVPQNLDRMRRASDCSLIRTLVRLLDDTFKVRISGFNGKNNELGIVRNVVDVFSNFASYAEFHSFLQTERVGSLVFRVLKYYVDELLSMQNKTGTDTVMIILSKCNQFLLLVAEDPTVQKKMQTKGITSIVCLSLKVKSRPWFNISKESHNLFISALHILQRLSIFSESKDEIKLQNDYVYQILLELFSWKSSRIQEIALLLLINMTFDLDIAKSIIENETPDVFAQLEGLLHKKSKFHKLSWKFLYLLSRSVITNLGSNINIGGKLPMSAISKIVFSYPRSEQIPVYISGVLVNLTSLRNNLTTNTIDEIFTEDFVQHIVALFLLHEDLLLLKVLRNIAHRHAMLLEQPFLDGDKAVQLSETKVDSESAKQKVRFLQAWKKSAYNLLKYFKSCAQGYDKEDFLPDLLSTITFVICIITKNSFENHGEIVGILKEYQVIQNLNNLLLPGFSKNDVLVQALFFFQHISLYSFVDESILNLIVSNTIPYCSSLLANSTDEEIIVQALFLFYRILKNFIIEHGSRQTLPIDNFMKSIEEIGSRCISMFDLYSDNEECSPKKILISCLTDAVLDLLMEIVNNSNIAEQIRSRSSEACSVTVQQINDEILLKRFKLYNSEYFKILEQDNEFDFDHKQQV